MRWRREEADLPRGMRVELDPLGQACPVLPIVLNWSVLQQTLKGLLALIHLLDLRMAWKPSCMGTVEGCAT